MESAKAVHLFLLALMAKPATPIPTNGQAEAMFLSLFVKSGDVVDNARRRVMFSQCALPEPLR